MVKKSVAVLVAALALSVSVGAGSATAAPPEMTYDTECGTCMTYD